MLERQRHGPIVAVCDWNTSIRYRRAGERAVFGRNFFSPLTHGVDTVDRVRDGAESLRINTRCASGPGAAAPPVPLIADHADPPLPERGDPPNRDLLAQLCLTTQLAVRQTFLEKDLLQ